MSSVPQFTIGQCAMLACQFEATAPKPGNVHRAADFLDLHFADFLVSATAIGPIFENSHTQSVGATVRESIEATRAMVNTNTNLGIVLLLAPLAKVPRHVDLREGIQSVLAQLTSEDARQVYEAIRMAQPGGLGTVEEHDVHDSPPPQLLAAMQCASERDLIARQYVTGYVDVFAALDRLLQIVLDCGGSLFDAIVWTHLGFLAKFGDSLIARKLGAIENQKAQVLARRTIDSGPEVLQSSFASFLETTHQNSSLRATVSDRNLEWSSQFWHEIGELDFWMRSRAGRNPGTTADLVTATLFCALRSETLQPPFRWQPIRPNESS